ncbi:MAG: hypothetical protein ACR2PT_11640 [Endozoicomonas sp.]
MRYIFPGTIVVFTLLLFTQSARGETAKFITQPENITVPCGSTALFECVGKVSTKEQNEAPGAGYIVWFIERTIDPDFWLFGLPEARNLKLKYLSTNNLTHIKSSLEIPTCDDQFNGTSVRCSMYPADLSSQVVTLTLEPGISRVDKLKLNYYEFRLHWDQAQALGYDNQPLLYVVRVYDASANTLVYANDQVAETSLDLYVNSNQFCRKFLARVTPYIEGQIFGETTQLHTFPPPWWFFRIKSIYLRAPPDKNAWFNVIVTRQSSPEIYCPQQFLFVTYTDGNRSRFFELPLYSTTIVARTIGDSDADYLIQASIHGPLCETYSKKTVKTMQASTSMSDSGSGVELTIADIKPTLCQPVTVSLNIPDISEISEGLFNKERSTSDIIPIPTISLIDPAYTLSSANSESTYALPADVLDPNSRHEPAPDEDFVISFPVAMFSISVILALIVGGIACGWY